MQYTITVESSMQLFKCKAISSFFFPFSVIRPTQIFGIFKKKKEVST